MPTQAWPASLPGALRRGVTTTPRAVVERVVSDAGVVRMRRRIAGDAGNEIRGEMLLLRNEFAILQDFYKRTTRYGVDPFTGLEDPITGDAKTLLGFAAPPVFRSSSQRTITVALALETRR